MHIFDETLNICCLKREWKSDFKYTSIHCLKAKFAEKHLHLRRLKQVGSFGYCITRRSEVPTTARIWIVVFGLWHHDSYPEDGRDTFLRNVGNHPQIYASSQPTVCATRNFVMYRDHSVVWLMISRRLQWAEHAARMVNTWNAYRILMKKPLKTLI
jgi:hypothetical protein